MDFRTICFLEFAKLPRKFYLILLIFGSLYYFGNLYISFFINSLNTSLFTNELMEQFPKDSIKVINLLFPFWIMLGIGFEFENKIVQRSISYGATISDFFWGKIFFVSIVISYFLALNMAGFILTSIHYSIPLKGNINFSIGLAAHLFIYLIGYGVVCLSIILAIRKGIVSLIVFYVYTFIEYGFGLILKTKYLIDTSMLPMTIIRSVNINNESQFSLLFTKNIMELLPFIALILFLFFISRFILSKIELEPL